MKRLRGRRIWVLSPILSLAILLYSCLEQKHDAMNTSNISGRYLGQEEPGDSAVVFAPGLISTGYDELNSVFSPEGNEFYYAIKRPNQDRHILMVVKLVNDMWTEPEVMAFSSLFGDADPAFSRDGDRMFFVSKRHMDSGNESGDWNIWFVDRAKGEWGEPKALGSKINTQNHEIHPSFAGNGNMYFSSNREGGYGGFDIYRVRWTGDEYADPENMGKPINTEYGEGDLFISREEEYIIFSSGRPGGFGRNDLYISFARADGSWTVPVNMGAEVNSSEIEYSPHVTSDGEYLFYSSYRRSSEVSEKRVATYEDISSIYSVPGNGLGDIYWISTKHIEKLRDLIPDI